jgi:hypothetical protein
MPETFGKRQRRDRRAKKIAVREERRVARNARREQRVMEGIPDTQVDREVEVPSDLDPAAPDVEPSGSDVEPAGS